MFASFVVSEPTWGVVRENGIVSGKRILNDRFSTLKALIAAGEMESALHEAAALEPDLDIDAVRFLPPVTRPEHVFCVGLNYADHVAETGRQTPEMPRFFLRATSSLTGHKTTICRPKVSTQFDYEGELAVIIARGGKHIPESSVIEHIAGYTCFMDGSVRDWQDHSLTLGKNFQGTGALGPYLIPVSLIPDSTKLTLTTRYNGREVQQSTTGKMIHSIPQLISYLSQVTELRPGDVVATGTPEGVGRRRNPQIWLKPGDQIEVDISNIGCLSNMIIAEPEP